MIALAIRYLIEKKRQTFFTLLGVFLGTTAYVTVSGFFLGFQGYMVQQLINNTAQIHIQARQDYLSDHDLDSAFFGSEVRHVFWASPPSGMLGFLGVQNPQKWYQRLREDPRVAAFSPILMAPALFTYSKISVSANIIGCNPLQQAKVTSIADYMQQGSFSDIAVGGNRIILGYELMKRVGAALNQTIFISSQSNNIQPFKVVGIFKTGNRGADLQAYGSISDIQKLNQTPNRVNEIAVKLVDYTQAAEIAKNWSYIAPEKTESWDQQNSNIFSVFKIQTSLRFAMIFTVLIVAGFGIYNVLNITVNQKKQDIAILRSMGFDTFDIVMLFFSQGLIIGVIGAACGLLAGYFLCLYLQTIPFVGPGQMRGGIPGTLHISLAPTIYIQAALVALVSASFAAIMPARAASRLTPIEIIRSGG